MLLLLLPLLLLIRCVPLQDALYDMELEPPHIPEIENEEDTSNFEEVEEPDSDEEAELAAVKVDQTDFESW